MKSQQNRIELVTRPDKILKRCNFAAKKGAHASGDHLLHIFNMAQNHQHDMTWNQLIPGVRTDKSTLIHNMTMSTSSHQCCCWLMSATRSRRIFWRNKNVAKLKTSFCGLLWYLRLLQQTSIIVVMEGRMHFYINLLLKWICFPIIFQKFPLFQIIRCHSYWGFNV